MQFGIIQTKLNYTPPRSLIEALSCREAVCPGRRALICPASRGRTCLAIRALRTALVAYRAEVLAEVGPEVPVLCEPAGRGHAGAGRESSPASWVTGSGEPGPEGPPAGAFGLCEPAEADLSSSYDFTSRPDGLARVVV